MKTHNRSCDQQECPNLLISSQFQRNPAGTTCLENDATVFLIRPGSSNLSMISLEIVSIRRGQGFYLGK